MEALRCDMDTITVVRNPILWFLSSSEVDHHKSSLQMPKLTSNNLATRTSNS